MNSTKFEEELEKKLDSMSKEEMLSYIPDSFIRSAVKGFLAGELGPKRYMKDSWIKRGMSRYKNLNSLVGHIKAFANEEADEDTGIEDVTCFVSARAVMNAELVSIYEQNK